MDRCSLCVLLKIQVKKSLFKTVFITFFTVLFPFSFPQNLGIDVMGFYNIDCGLNAFINYPLKMEYTNSDYHQSVKNQCGLI